MSVVSAHCPCSHRFDQQNYTPDGHKYTLDFCLLWDFVIAYRLILLSPYIVFCTHILIDGCHGIPPHCRISYYLGILSLPTHIDHIIYIPITYFLCYLQSSGLFYCVTRTRLVSAGLCLRWCATPLRFPPFFYLREKKIIELEFGDRVALV